MSKKYRSDAMSSIHETMEALHKTGAIKKQTMRHFDEAYLARVGPVKARARKQGVRGLEEHFNRIDQKTKDIPDKEMKEALDEALRSVRPRYRERE